MATLSPAERKAIAGAAAEVAAENDAGEVPPLSELMAMSTDELVALFEQFGVRVDVEALETDVRADLGRSALTYDRRDQLTPDQQGRLEAAVSRAVVKSARRVVNKAIGDMRQAAFVEADERPADEQAYVWIAVLGKRTCGDCRDRHGLVFLYDAWEAAGLPRTGATVCEDDCKCMVLPCGMPAEGQEGLRP